MEGPPAAARRFTHGLRPAAFGVAVGILVACLVGLPAESSGETKSKQRSSGSNTVKKAASRSSDGSSRKTTSQRPDYKSKYKKPDPPAGGDRPPRYKDNRPANPKTKPRQPRRKPQPPPHRKQPVDPGPGDTGHWHPIPPPQPPVIIVYESPTYYDGPYYEEPRRYEPDPGYSLEDANLVFTAGSIAINYFAFIRQAEVNNVAAGVGFFFGVTSFVVASSPNAEHPVLGYLLGASAIAFSVWNLGGGAEPVYTDEEAGVYDPYPPRPLATQSVGWSFSF